jgi:predicted ATPase/DNA-binding winged helix-turn-helix (wHTH) protein
MSQQGPNLVYESGRWQIDLRRRELLACGVSVPIGARAFEVMEALVLSANELVTKDALMDRVWPGAIVGENTLQGHMSAIRKALGPDRSMVKTVSGRGYRLVGSWTPRKQGSAAQMVMFPPMSEAGAPPVNNFPSGAGRLIGRDAAVRHVRDLVCAYRVVTLTGPGGIGKTSLAIEAAGGLVANFDGGGWFVDFASLSDPDLVPSAVASALGLGLGGEVSAEFIAHAVGAKHLLLVLDNCEHVVGAAADLAERFIHLCPHTTILGTSREVLRVEGEHVYRVAPLDVPALGQETPAPGQETPAPGQETPAPGQETPALGQETPDRIMDHSAVQLFIARTTALDTDRTPRAEDLASVAAICRHLDGIPLAIEFAAVSAATLGIGSVAMGLSDRFALLTRGHRTALPRHRTLRAVLDWSYELLTDAERLLLRRLAIFPAGFTLDAAAAVMTDTEPHAAAVTDGIANLVSKSLIMIDKSEKSSRWYLLETTRAYALEKLRDSGETWETARWQAEFRLAPFAPPGSRGQLQAAINDLGRSHVSTVEHQTAPP